MKLRKRFPKGILVKLKPRAIPRLYIPKDATFKVGETVECFKNIFVTYKGLGFFVSPSDIIEIEEKVIFT